MSTYQIYDFFKDVDLHIKNKNPIDLKYKSEVFKYFLYSLSIFQLKERIKKDHPIFSEKYFIFILLNNVYIAKRLGEKLFDYIEIKNGIKLVRNIKIKKLGL